ncbi:MAG: hypothetical protein ACT4O3_01840 [Elusimicrobiota bacterium]
MKALKKQIPLAALGLIAFFLPRLLKPLPAEERPVPPPAEAPADPEAPAAARLDPFRLLDDEERDIVFPLIRLLSLVGENDAALVPARGTG